MANERIDKWLCNVRIFKSRSLASESCKRKRVSVNGLLVKPGHEVNVGDEVIVRKPPITFKFRVIGFPPSRVGASLVPRYAENLTSPEELQKLSRDFGAMNLVRDPGTGRPTKKERRTLDQLFSAEQNFSEHIDYEDVMDTSFDDFDDDFDDDFADDENAADNF